MLFGEGPQIKNIAADLNKLFRQGSMLNQSGQTVDGDSTADQGTSDLLAARDPVIQAISVGMSGEQSARYTVSGTPPLSLPNSLGKPLKAWSVEVSPYQEGTGDPSPDNVRAIHGTDKVNLYCGSPNIWDETVELGAISAINGANENENNSLRTAGYIPIIPEADYIIICSALTVFNARTRFYDADKNYIGYVQKNGNAVAYNTAFTAPTNAYYMRIAFQDAYGTTYNHDIAVNYPATVTDYNPHQGGITSITLPQTVYAGTIGSEGGESRWGEVDLGTISWISHATLPNVYTGDGRYLPQWKRIGATAVANALCSEYKLTTSAAGGVDAIDFSIALGSGTSMNIYVHNSAVVDINEFITAISGVQLAYELETPTTFATPSVTIPTPTGTATTWATAEDGTVDDMEVTYVGKA